MEAEAERGRELTPGRESSVNIRHDLLHERRRDAHTADGDATAFRALRASAITWLSFQRNLLLRASVMVGRQNRSIGKSSYSTIFVFRDM